MEIEFEQRKENPLLDREEIKFVVTHPAEASPERETVRQNVAAQAGANTGLVVVDGMQTEYGVTRTTGYAKVYDSVEALRDVEEDYVLERNGLPTGEDSDEDEGGSADEAEDAADEADEADEPDEAEEADEGDEGDEGDDEADEEE